MSTNTIQDAKRADPRTQGPKPEFPQKPIAYPGSTDEMNPRPDHGEETYKGLGRLTDKVAVITGADSGIGRAVAVAFAREGADIVLGYLPEEEKDAIESAGWIRQSGRKAIQAPGDILSEQNCIALADRARRNSGRLIYLSILPPFNRPMKS